MKKYVITIIAIVLLTTAADAQTPVVNDEKIVFTKVDQEAKFPGGMEGWKTYLEKNLDANLGRFIKLKKKEKFGQQTVKVQFLVDKAGKISNVMAVNKTEVHPRLSAEAIRVVKEGPDWIPAEQNGRKVIYQAVQYITWQAEAE